MIVTAIIVQAIIVVVLVVVLSQFMKGSVSNQLGHVKTISDEMIKQQEALRKKLQEAEKEYTTKMERLNTEIAAKQAQAKTEAAKIMDEARTSGMQEKDRLIQEAIQTKDKFTAEIMAQLDEKAVEHAKLVIGKYLTGAVQQSVHEVLVQEIVLGIRDIPVEHFQIQTDTADLTTALPLSDAAKEQLKNALQEKIKREVKFNEKVSPALVSGITLQMGTFVIDGSLAHRLNEAAALLKRELNRKYQVAS